MLLAINTAGQEISIALFWPNKIQKTKKWLSKKSSENLLLKIDQLLKENKLNLKDLKAIVINRGPGSFTGLRVGISTTNALTYVLKIPAIGIKNEPEILKIVQKGYQELQSEKNKTITQVRPYYGDKLR